jgi:hypothetical protein
MKKPDIICPACLEVHHLTTRDEWVSICSIVYNQFLTGASNYQNYTVVPSHCSKDNYTKCAEWRTSKNEEWMRKHGFSSMEQMEKIRL